MIKKLVILILLLNVASAKQITPNEVYAQVMLITQEMHFILEHYGIEHKHHKVEEHIEIKTALKPRNVWQKTYEIMMKINMFRVSKKLPIVEPVNMAPVLNLNPDLVYEQTQRILTEIKIFKYRLGLNDNDHKEEHKEVKIYKNKTPLDVFNSLANVSSSFDNLNKAGFTPSYVFGETMRIYDDLTTILQHLKLADKTIPTKRDEEATPKDTFNVSFKILDKIKQIQFSVGIDTVDFSAFKKDNPNPSDVFGMTQMILAELQTIKAYIGLLHYSTPTAIVYNSKTPADVDQLMNWNLRKISLIEKLKGSLR